MTFKNFYNEQDTITTLIKESRETKFIEKVKKCNLVESFRWWGKISEEKFKTLDANGKTYKYCKMEEVGGSPAYLLQSRAGARYALFRTCENKFHVVRMKSGKKHIISPKGGYFKETEGSLMFELINMPGAKEIKGSPSQIKAAVKGASVKPGSAKVSTNAGPSGIEYPKNIPATKKDPITPQPALKKRQGQSTGMEIYHQPPITAKTPEEISTGEKKAKKYAGYVEQDKDESGSYLKNMVTSVNDPNTKSDGVIKNPGERALVPPLKNQRKFGGYIFSWDDKKTNFSIIDSSLSEKRHSFPNTKHMGNSEDFFDNLMKEIAKGIHRK